ncbi:MAG: UvrD-helicase domain-containing protein, partial [Clostridiaceae bacterium]|nr:UvrD-helicase domain-containing protein [Clostridiaceae bacterium]
MSNFSWTSEQEAAIDFSAKANLLVSAAAGSGKTAVLSERIISRAIAGDLDLSRVLVMTFTDLAAKQMKNRIEARLVKARSDAETAADIDHLDALLRIFPQTRISTIHSFCNRLLGDYLAEFKGDRGEPLLEPGYALLDEEAAAGLLDEVLDELLSHQYALLDDRRHNRLQADWPEEYYSKIDVLLARTDPLDYLSDFDRLSTGYAPGLSDRSFREALKQVLGKLRSLPDYRNLVRRAVNSFAAEVEDFPSQDLLDHFFSIYFEHYKKMKVALRQLEGHPHYERVRNSAKEGVTIQRQLDLMDHAGKLVESLDDISAATIENFKRISEAGRQLDGVSMPAKVADKGSDKTINHNDFVDLMSSDIMSFFYLINDNNKISTGKKQEYFPDVQALFTVSLQEMQEDLKISVGPVARFFELVLALDKEFQKEKFSRNLLEFADFEHGAFRLLQEENIRLEVQNRYDEIYIDEYQDTSSIQDGIVSAIAGDNIFMVGDVKQSIYRFRYANPALFQQRSDKAVFFTGSADTEVKDYLLNLSTNFRSQSNIIDFVNEVFSSFLTREAAEIEYDESQRLYVRPGAGEPGKVSWRILTNTGEDLPEPSDAENDYPLNVLSFTPANEFQRLSLLAADTIRSLQDEGAELKDIALLCCTNAQCKTLRDSLEKQGIPVTGTFGGIYPENLLMRQFEALLNVLDNPRQDIPLASYLASALCGDPLSPAEFMRIRPLAERKFPDEEKPRLRYFHERVMLIEDFLPCEDERDEKIRLKVKQAMDRIKHWRLLARELSNRDLLSLILQESQFEKLLEQSDGSPAGLRDSRRRLSELKQFLDFVKESSFQGFDSVQKLLQRLEKLRKRDIFPDDSDLQSDLDAVRVLTYHKSKGLQWPNVILLGLGNNQVRAETDLISIDE